MLAQLIAAELFAPLMVFIRVGSALMVLPAIGDSVVTPRTRLMLALLISLLTSPMLSSAIPSIPDSPIALGLLILGEILIGIFLGLVARILLAASPDDVTKGRPHVYGKRGSVLLLRQHGA